MAQGAAEKSGAAMTSGVATSLFLLGLGKGKAQPGAARPVPSARGLPRGASRARRGPRPSGALLGGCRLPPQRAGPLPGLLGAWSLPGWCHTHTPPGVPRGKRGVRETSTWSPGILFRIKSIRARLAFYFGL